MKSARDADATRTRILAAALTEFAAVGHAGGRVERIARGAGTNVRMIYAYFGNKAGLFDATVRSAVEHMAAEVPPEPEALAQWAGRVFDYHQADPAPLRVSMWAQLERPEVAAEPMEAYLAKTVSVAEGAGDETSSIDLLAIIYAIAQAWIFTPVGLLSADGSDPSSPERIARHRSSVVAAVEAIAPGPQDSSA